MAKTDVLTDAEIDALLRRFDQTAPALQRRIIAEFVCRAADLEAEAARLRAEVGRLRDRLTRALELLPPFAAPSDVLMPDPYADALDMAVTVPVARSHCRKIAALLAEGKDKADA